MGVTVYFPNGTGGEPTKLFIADGVKISSSGGDAKVIIVNNAAGQFSAMFTADNILGAVVDPGTR